MAARSALSLGLGLACLLVLAACAGVRGPVGGGSLRLSEVMGESDPARRASLRLCIDGLDADEDGRVPAARSQYERAIQIDPNNPYAYLALARHQLEWGDAERALLTVGRAEALLRAEGTLSPRVEAHLLGLRGGALGQAGARQLEAARERAPAVWGDGRLDAHELR